MEVSRMHRAAVTLREAVMFTVTMGRTLTALSLVAAVTSASSRAGAQIIVRTGDALGGGLSVVSHRIIQVSDDSVRSYLTRFEPSVLDDASGDANIVTMVLDSDGTYIRSTARHAKMIQAVPGQVIAVNGDSVRAFTVGSGRVLSINGDSTREIRLSTFGDARSIATGGTVVALNGMETRVAGSAGMLADVAPDEVGAISTKRYAAGEMGKGPVIVTFVYLK
jgi:hypothetical protein